MCKINDCVHTLRKYISDITGNDILIKEMQPSVKSRLPLVVTETFCLYTGSIFGVAVVFAIEDDTVCYTPMQIEKLLDLIKSNTGLTSIYVSDDIASYNMKRLMGRRVNFIVPYKQMFVPSLLLDIRNKAVKGHDVSDVILPFTQFLLLFHLQKEVISGFSSKDISSMFNVSYATANRAVRWFVEKKLAKVEDSKEHKLMFMFKGRELWENALQYLVSPIYKTVRVDNVVEGALRSGTNALAKYTMLNENEEMRFAISKDDYRSLEQNGGIDINGNVTLEVWKYPPRILSEIGAVDRLSLFLLLRDNSDERIQIELEHLIDGMAWLEE